MLKLITDIQPGEPDILSPVRFHDLIIKDLDEVKIADSPAPKHGWTHEALEDAVEQLNLCFKDGADAYLGPCWVGGTEV